MDGPPRHFAPTVSPQRNEDAIAERLETRMLAAAEARESLRATAARTAASEVARARYLHARARGQEAHHAATLAAEIQRKQAASDARRAEALAARKQKAAEGYASLLGSLQRAGAGAGAGSSAGARAEQPDGARAQPDGARASPVGASVDRRAGRGWGGPLTRPGTATAASTTAAGAGGGAGYTGRGGSSAASHYSSFTAWTGGTHGTQGATLHSRRSDASTLTEGAGLGLAFEGGFAEHSNTHGTMAVSVSASGSVTTAGAPPPAAAAAAADDDAGDARRAARATGQRTQAVRGHRGRERSRHGPWAADYGHLLQEKEEEEEQGEAGGESSSHLGSPSLPSDDAVLMGDGGETSHRDRGMHEGQGEEEEEGAGHHVDLGEHREGMLRDGMGRASVERTSHDGSGSEEEDEHEHGEEQEVHPSAGRLRVAAEDIGDTLSADDLGSTAPLPLSPATSARRTVGSVRFELYSGPRDPPAPAPTSSGGASAQPIGPTQPSQARAGSSSTGQAPAGTQGGSTGREGAAVKGILRNSSTSPSLTFSSRSGVPGRQGASRNPNPNVAAPLAASARAHAAPRLSSPDPRPGLYLTGGVDEEEDDDDDLDLDAPSEGLHPVPLSSHSTRHRHGGGRRGQAAEGEAAAHGVGDGLGMPSHAASSAQGMASASDAALGALVGQGVGKGRSTGRAGGGTRDSGGVNMADRREHRSASLAETYTFSSGFQARVLTRSSGMGGVGRAGGMGGSISGTGAGAAGGQEGAEEEEDGEEGDMEGAGHVSHASVDAHAPEGEEEEQDVGLGDDGEGEEGEGGEEGPGARMALRDIGQAGLSHGDHERRQYEEEEEDGEGESTSRSAAEVASGVVAVAATTVGSSHGLSGSSTVGSEEEGPDMGGSVIGEPDFASSSHSEDHMGSRHRSLHSHQRLSVFGRQGPAPAPAPPPVHATPQRQHLSSAPVATGGLHQAAKLIPPSPVLLPATVALPAPAPWATWAGRGSERGSERGPDVTPPQPQPQPPQSLLERLMRKTPPRAEAPSYTANGYAYGGTGSLPALARSSTYPLPHVPSFSPSPSPSYALGQGPTPPPPDFLHRRTGVTGVVASRITSNAAGGKREALLPAATATAMGSQMQPLPVVTLAPLPPATPPQHVPAPVLRPPGATLSPSSTSGAGAGGAGARARSSSVEERILSARTRDAQWTSRVVLASESKKRNARTARVQTVTDLREAERRRVAALQSRRERAHAHDQHVAHVHAHVKAAKRVQRWYKRRRILQLVKRPRSAMPSTSAAAHGTGIQAGAAVTGVGVAVGKEKRGVFIEHSPIRGPPAPTDTSSSSMAVSTAAAASSSSSTAASSVGAEGGEGWPSSLSAHLRACAAAVQAVDHAGAAKARRGLHAVLCGKPALDDGRSLEAAMTELREELAAQGVPSASLPAPPPPTILPPSVFSAQAPYPSFDACALAIQQRCNIAAAQAVIGQLMSVYQALEEGGVISAAAAAAAGVGSVASGTARAAPRHTGFTPVRPSTAAGKGASPSTGPSSAAAHASDLSADGNPSLRPALARSSRTLLASLLIAYFPADILSTGGMQDEGAAAVDVLRGGTGPGQAASSGSAAHGQAAARHTPLISAAKRLLGHLHAFCELFSTASPAPASVPGPALGLDPADRPDLGLDASLHVLPSLRAALQGLRVPVPAAGATTASAADPDRCARIVHATLCLLSAWCAYMDSFMAWKHGDGMRAAQALARPYRALLVRRAELTQEANTRIGAGDAGLEQLREGVEGQLVAIRGQLVALLGSASASRWERDQGVSLEAEIQRDAMRKAAAQAQGRSMQQAQQGQGQAQGQSAAGSDTRPSSVALPGNASRMAAASGVTGFTPPTARNAMGGPTTGSGRRSGGAFSPGFLLAGRPPRSPARPAPTGSAASVPEVAVTTGVVGDGTGSPSTPQPGATGGAGHGMGSSSPAGPHVPPGATSSPQAALFRSVMRNEGLAHELMIDPTFRLPDLPAPEGLLDWDSIQDSDYVTEGAGEGTSGATGRVEAGMGSSPVPAAAGHAAETGTALAALGRRVSTGEAGLSVGSSPSLASVHAGLALIQQQQQQQQQQGASVQAGREEEGEGILPPLDLPPTASSATQPPSRARLRVRHKGQTRLTPAMAQDPAFLRTCPWFWEAALSAATDAEQASAAVAPGHAGIESPGPEGAQERTSNSSSSGSSPAIDLVLAGLESIRESLISLVPHRTDLHADIRAHVDLDLFRTMLQSKAFSHTDWIALLRYIGRLISALEAPARNDETSAWLTGAEAFVRTIARRRADAKAAVGRAAKEGSVLSAEPAGKPASSATLDDDLLVLLPRVFAWAHYKTAQIRLDTSNAHLATLGPYLLEGGRGAEYERSKFESQLAKGAVSTAGVQTWLKLVLSQAVTEASKDARLTQGITDAQAEASGRIARIALQADYKISRFCLLRDGLLLLLASPHPLTMVATVASRSADGIARLPDPASGSVEPAASAAPPSPGVLHTTTSAGASAGLLSLPFPETFQLDAKRLMDAQNTVQKVALLGALTALLQQVVSSLPACPAGYVPLPPSYPALRVPTAAYTGVARGTLYSTAASVAALSKAADREEAGSDRLRSIAGVQACLASWLGDEGLRLPELQQGLAAAVDTLARLSGRVPFLLPSQQEQEGTLPAGVVSTVTSLRSTLSSAVERCVSTSHPLFATFCRRVLEGFRRKITREMQDTMPPSGDTNKAQDLPAWKKFLDAPGAPLPGLLASAFPASVPAVDSEVNATVRMLARLIRHNHAVFEPHYKQWLAEA